MIDVKLRILLSQGPKFGELGSYNSKDNFTPIRDAVVDYARRWANVDDNTLSECVEWIMYFVNGRIFKLLGSMKNNSRSILSSLTDLYATYFIVQVVRAANNLQGLLQQSPINELGLNDSTENPTYTQLCKGRHFDQPEI